MKSGLLMVRPATILILVSVCVLNTGVDQIAWATYQLPQKARTRLDELATLRLAAEGRVMEITGIAQLNIIQNGDYEIIDQMVDCQKKYEIARRAYSKLIDVLVFLSEQGQEFSEDDVQNTEKVARKRRKEFWECSVSPTRDIGISSIIKFDGESIKQIVELIFEELRKIKVDRERRNVLKEYADALKKEKWLSWNEINKIRTLANELRGGIS